MKPTTKNVIAALMVAPLSTLVVSAPKVDSIAPPPMAAPMPPSFLARCMRTTKTMNTDVAIRTKERMPISRLIKGAETRSSDPSCQPKFWFLQAPPSEGDPELFEHPLEVLIALV